MAARGALLVFVAILSPLAQAQSAADVQRLLDAGLKKEKERDFDGAIAAYTQALTFNPRHAKAMGLRAEARLRQEDYDGAIADSTKAIDLDPKYARAFAVRSLAGRHRDNPAISPVGDGKQAQTLDPKDAYGHYALACSYTINSQFDRAIATIAKAIELDPAMAAAWSARGEFKLGKGEHAGAMEDVGHAIDLAPADPDAYVVRGRIYQDLGQWDNAFADYTKAIALDPKGIRGLVSRGQANNLRHHFPEAAEDASKALSLRPQSVEAYDVRARARLLSGNRKEALADYDQSIKLHPTGWRHNQRGWARVEDGAWADAAADFRKYLQQTSDKLAPSLWICVCRVRAGEATQAKEELMKSFEFEKQNPSNWHWAVFQYLTGQMTEDKFQSSANAPQPDNSKERLCVASFYVGMIKAAEGRIAAATMVYERCAETKERWLNEYRAAAADLERLKNPPAAPAKAVDLPPLPKTFAASVEEASRTVWSAIVDKKAVLQKQTIVLKKPAIGEAPYTIKDVTPKSLVLETQFGGGLVESVEKPESLPVDILLLLLQKASLLPNGDLRKSIALLFAGSSSFDLAYRELAKAKTEGAAVADLYVLVAMEEVSRAATKSTPQARLAALNTLSAQRASVWPEDLRQRLAQLVASEEKEVRRSEGLLGWRIGDRLAAAQRGGGGKDTEAAVLAALKWLARHQGPDGAWSTEAFHKQCSGNACGGPGFASYDTGITALSVLAFLGAGYTPASKEEFPDPATPDKVLKVGPAVKKGIEWLLSKQDPEGCVGERGQKYMYNHLIAAIALTESYAMTTSPGLRAPAQKAIDFVVAAQNPGKGWRYSAKCADNDTSVTGWGVMALKSAEASGLSFPRSSYMGALNWFNEATEQNNPGNAYLVGYNQARTGKVFVPGKNEQFDHHPSMSAVSVVSRLFIEKRKSDPTLAAVTQLLADIPEWKSNKIDSYYWYYASLALFQYDGPDGANWKKWNGFMKYALVPNQRTAQHGCRNGSWDPDVERWGSECGRVGETALNALTLETYYRYAPAVETPKAK